MRHQNGTHRRTKDTIPPHLVKVVPSNKSLNFKGDKIVMTFDEFIKTKDINNQLIITPRLEEESEFKVNKNTLTIELQEPLDSSTTYTFNFQESVQDITESTPARDLVLAYSTGTYIDSLYISGQIKELLTDKPVENAIVALYPAGDTLDIFNSKPQYFTKSKKDGSYLLENLKNANYRLYAFNDNNKNLTTQSDLEAYGFIADSIALDSSITEINIPLIKRNVKEFKLQSARPNGKYYEVKMNKYIDTYTLSILDDKPDSLVSNIIPDQNLVRVYNTFSNTDSIQTRVNVVDTIGQVYTDTVYVRFAETKRESDPLSFKLLPATGTTIEEAYTGTIKFNKPVKINQLDSAFFYYDSLHVDTIKTQDLSWNNSHDEVTITKTLNKKVLEEIAIAANKADSIKRSLPKVPADTAQKSVENPEQTPAENNERGEGRSIRERREDTKPPGKQVGEKPTVSTKSIFDKRNNQILLYLAKGSMISIENDTVPQIDALYSFKKSEDTGLIKGSILTDKQSYFIQLLDNSFKVVKEIKGSADYKFNLIPPGEYKLRILIDNDGDGTWYAGNILENKPPEDVIFYKEPIVIRANWERELDAIEF